MAEFLTYDELYAENSHAENSHAENSYDGPEDMAAYVPSENGADGHSSTPRETAATVLPLRVEPPQIAYSTTILDDFKREIRWHGVVGEETIVATVYLALTSRLLDKPVSLAVKGNSSSGKSFTVQTTVRFFPVDARIEMTGMSERALVYSPDEYKNRTILLYEAEGLRENASEDNQTAYFVRSLLSEGRIDYYVTVRSSDSSWTAKKIVKEGPTNLIFTTTRTKVHGENETRVLSLTTNDSQEQTRNILAELANEHRQERDLTDWHQLQRWLQTAEHRVTIPYGPRLARAIPPVAQRLRRDFAAVLSLIRAHAVLHQLTRARDDAGRIVATLEDYSVVRELVNSVISEGVGRSVTDTTRETVVAVEEMAETQKDGVTAQALAKRLGIDKSAARRRLLHAADGGYVRNQEDRRGHPGRWLTDEPLPGPNVLLPPPEEVRATSETAIPQPVSANGGTVASDSEGVLREIAALDPADPAHGMKVAQIRADACGVPKAESPRRRD
jgi:hypothetical protein